jgi:hypothetical protein
MPDRVVFVQLKTGYPTDQGPCWICRARFTKTWQSVQFHGRTLRRQQTVYGNFVDVESGEEWWVSGPKRDRTDARYSGQQPVVDDEVRAEYEAFLAGAPLPGREHG